MKSDSQKTMTDEILNKTAVFRHDFFEKHTELLQQLANSGQSPEALFIGCSDSRVTPEQLLGAAPGDLFMLRNVANIIPPYHQTEIGIVSVLEYALMRLKVRHLIVCGHTDCGGIFGLDEKVDISKEPALSRWLELARPAQLEVDRRFHELSSQERHLAIVRQNVIHQLANIQTYPFVRSRLEADQLELHGWVYDLSLPEISYFNPHTNQFK